MSEHQAKAKVCSQIYVFLITGMLLHLLTVSTKVQQEQPSSFAMACLSLDVKDIIWGGKKVSALKDLAKETYAKPISLTKKKCKLCKCK